jgi:hypothetical protein
MRISNTKLRRKGHTADTGSTLSFLLLSPVVIPCESF